eukprot:269292-Pelagomonas_calceolata.AAC.10
MQRATPPKKRGSVYVGTSGWCYAHWRGRFFPKVKTVDGMGIYLMVKRRSLIANFKILDPNRIFTPPQHAQGLKQKDEFSYLAERVSSLEVNGTFYGECSRTCGNPCVFLLIVMLLCTPYGMNCLASSCNLLSACLLSSGRVIL